MRCQAIFILVWAVLATVMPLTSLAIRGDYHKANWLTLHFSLPLLLAGFPPVFYVFVIDMGHEKDILKNFARIFFPVYGAVVMIMVIFVSIAIDDIVTWSGRSGETGNPFLRIGQKVRIGQQVCMGVALIGALAFAMPYVEDTKEQLSASVKIGLFYLGYYLSTAFCLSLIYVLPELENYTKPQETNKEVYS